jgi:hypothetical protein
MFTSLYDIDTPGNLFDCTTVTFSGLGGNDAALAPSAREHSANEAFDVNMTMSWIRQYYLRRKCCACVEQRYVKATLYKTIR